MPPIDLCCDDNADMSNLPQVYKSPHLWNWQLSPKWKFAYMDLVKSMASAAQGHQTWMLAWRCGSKLLREYASSMRKEHQIEVRSVHGAMPCPPLSTLKPV